MARTAHGRAAELGRLTATECKPWDEQPPASPVLTSGRNEPPTDALHRATAWLGTPA